MSDYPFQKTQRQFAAHLRRPDSHAAPGDIEDRRLNIYRELFYNNVQNFLANGFPVIRSITADDVWHQLVRNFFADHSCHSPYFVEIAKAFVEYLSANPAVTEQLPGWFLELAHYEWMEVALDISHDEMPRTGFNPEGDLLAAAPMLTPLMCVLSYHWPVHCIGPEFVPEQLLATPVWLVVYRNSEDQVKFMEINIATAALLQQLEASPLATGREVLLQVGAQFGLDQEKIIAFGIETLSHLRSRGILLGTRIQNVEELDA